MAFPPTHIHPSQTTHTHTIILLHGRGSNGLDFADELFSSESTKKQNLPSQLPSWRWVFPTARERWDTRFQEHMDAWFDIYSLTNTDERQELQTEGLRESVGYILDIVEKEIALLNGRAERLFLGGMSQGMATILWTLLCSPIRLGGTRLGGVVAFCGWLPFAGQIEAIVESHPDSSAVDKSTLVGRHLLKILGYTPLQIEEREFGSVVSTPVFLSHGTDDAWVDVALGRQARQLIRQMGIQTEWREYLGADNDGHWIKEPEGIDDVVRFLQSHAHIN